MDYIIPPSSDGATVLQVLTRDIGVSRATLKHLKFKENGIMLGGVHVTVRKTVSCGDVLSIAIEDTQTPQKLTPSELELNIAFENDDLVIPDKPADMPTHQSFGHYGDTVANALAYRYSQMGLPFVFRPVNRLDRNTSGLLIIARSRLSAAFLSNAMKDGRIKKKYVAILTGVLPNDCGIIDTYMRRTAQSVIVREVCDENGGGDRAVTEYSVVCRSKTHTLVCATPITGRTHQLRVHFAHLGCPIEGDDIYGEPSEHISRHALHSFLLTLPLPDSNKEITVSAPMHDDMLSLAKVAFGDALYRSDCQILSHILPAQKDINK